MIGDCAACPQPGGVGDVPPRAQAAHQEASHLVKQLPRRLRGEPLKPYVYRAFGSLVSLGRSTVGNLMGFLVGKNFFIEGYFARLMYHSLYKMHEAALHGLANMILDTIGRFADANFKLRHHLFLSALCDVLDVPLPNQASHDAAMDA
jgi:NADH:ubiquinone reductase (H+-translocating)